MQLQLHLAALEETGGEVCLPQGGCWRVHPSAGKRSESTPRDGSFLFLWDEGKPWMSLAFAIWVTSGVEFCYTKTCYTRTVLVWTCGHLRARAHAHACRYTLFAGGFNKTGGESDVVDVYDSASGDWSVLKLSAPRALMTTAVTATAGGNTAAYFAGGQFRNGTKSDAIDVFTVSASSDGIAASTLVHSVLCLSSARSMLAATAVDGPDVTSQYVLFGGGELKENESHTSTTQDSAIVDVRIYTVYIQYIYHPSCFY